MPIKADTDVSDDDLRGHHLLMIGRPECSELIERLSHSLPVMFGPRSFAARGQLYADADSAVIAAGANPMDSRYSVVCVAGLSAGRDVAYRQIPARRGAGAAEGDGRDTRIPRTSFRRRRSWCTTSNEMRRI